MRFGPPAPLLGMMLMGCGPSGAGGSVTYERTAFVSTTGNDGTGALNNLALPFLTLGAAFTALDAAHPSQATTVRFLNAIAFDSVAIPANMATAGLTLKGHAGLVSTTLYLTLISNNLILTLDALVVQNINWNANDTAAVTNGGQIIGLNGGNFNGLEATGADGAEGADTVGEFEPGGDGGAGGFGRTLTVNGASLTGGATLGGGPGGAGGDSVLDVGGNGGNGGDGGDLIRLNGATTTLASGGGGGGPFGSGALGNGTAGSAGGGIISHKGRF